jgi:hypothetical protein
MPGIRFEVEQAVRIAYHLPVVMARIIEPQIFELGEAATLGGCRLVQFLEIPNALRADGTPRVDLFAFALEDPEELALFIPGVIVELIP